MKKILVYLIIIILANNIVPLQAINNGENNKFNTDSLLSEAMKAYQKGEFEYAAKLYNTLYEAGFSSPELFYNLGNTYYKSNKIGLAILFYEKALLLKPNDEDIKYNLDLAKTKIVDKPQEIDLSFITKIWNNIKNKLTLTQWGILSITLFCIFFITVVFFLISKSIIYKKISFYSAIAIIILTIFSIIFTHQQYKTLNDSHFGIIMPPSVTIKASPDENSVNLFIVHEGTKIQITDTLNEWLEIRLSDGKTGWLKANQIQKI